MQIIIEARQLQNKLFMRSTVLGVAAVAQVAGIDSCIAQIFFICQAILAPMAAGP